MTPPLATGASSQSSNSPPAKRAACDRCRGQKLRCLREDRDGFSKSSKCLRCISAGATCSFSASKRAGRPPSTNKSMATEKRSKNKAGRGSVGSTKGKTNTSCSQAASGSSESRQPPPQPDTESLLEVSLPEQDSFDQQNAAAEALHSLVTPPSASEASDLLSADSLAFPQEQETLPMSLDWAGEGLTSLFGREDTGSSDSFAAEFSWPFSQSPAKQGLDALSGVSTSAIEGHMLDEHSSNFPLPDSADLTMRGMSSLPIGTTPFDLPPFRDRRGSLAFSADLTPQSTSFPEKSSDYFEQAWSSGSGETQHRRMQELSELGMNLYAQITANEAPTPVSAGGNGVQLQDLFVGNVLKSSATFLNLLTSFYPFSRTSTTQTSTTRSSTLTSREASSSPSGGSDTSEFVRDDGSSGPWTCGSRSLGSPDSSKPFPADMTTIFQLLTCYIRVIHLHNILYSRMVGYLMALNRKEGQIAPLFPGMQIGGVSLDEFQKFQVKLLLQISAHLLGEIEMALGLPDGFRVSRKNSLGQGILETSVSVQFVEMTMREHGRTGLGFERDRVKSIKDNLGTLKQLLRGSINI